jgi:protein-S-isoprenylcysteine O-methyltransferase Ste14
MGVTVITGVGRSRGASYEALAIIDSNEKRAIKRMQPVVELAMSTQATVSPAKLAVTGLYLLLWPVLLFLLAGNRHWIEGWIFSGWFVALCATCTVWLYFKDPALLAERYRRPGSGGQKRWDKLVVYAIMLGFIAWIVIMPLDAQRFGWTPQWPVWPKACGGAMLVLSSFFFFRSFTDNPFLSPLVRIQAERKQRVVSTGVYGLVRHPMYLGAILMFEGVPLLLGSVWGTAVGTAMALLLAARIVGEEKLLLSELEGYDDYRKKVRYRLLPFIW